jgi:hypothetical protein
MTWSYTITDLATSTKDQVRFLIGDTLTTDQQLQDEEIVFAISQRASVWGAAAECCRSLASKFARSVDTAAGASKQSYSQLAKAYTIKTNEFESRAAMGGAGMPYAGGISIADKLAQEQNEDRVSPQFQVGMDDNFLPVAPAGNESSVPPGDVGA